MALCTFLKKIQKYCRSDDVAGWLYGTRKVLRGSEKCLMHREVPRGYGSTWNGAAGIGPSQQNVDPTTYPSCVRLPRLARLLHPFSADWCSCGLKPDLSNFSVSVPHTGFLRAYACLLGICNPKLAAKSSCAKVRGRELPLKLKDGTSMFSFMTFSFGICLLIFPCLDLSVHKMKMALSRAEPLKSIQSVPLIINKYHYFQLI